VSSPYDTLPPVPSFALSSDDVVDGSPFARAQLSAIFGAGGEDRSPHLRWSGHPADTRSFAVSCFDADAPNVSGFWHWFAYDLPASLTELPSGVAPADRTDLPVGGLQVRNDARLLGFLGAAPPPGRRHRYFIAVHALDVATLGIDGDVSPAMVSFNVVAATIARAVIMATCER
jgi:Raf kinase inhibitor-like YbhB/YbcL family protein